MPNAPAKLRPYFQYLRKVPLRLTFYRDSQMRDIGEGFLEYEQREGKPAYIMSKKQLRARRRVK
jgi:hypothetical protein